MTISLKSLTKHAGLFVLLASVSMPTYAVEPLAKVNNLSDNTIVVADLTFGVDSGEYAEPGTGGGSGTGTLPVDPVDSAEAIECASEDVAENTPMGRFIKRTQEAAAKGIKEMQDYSFISEAYAADATFTCFNKTTTNDNVKGTGPFSLVCEIECYNDNDLKNPQKDKTKPGNAPGATKPDVKGDAKPVKRDTTNDVVHGGNKQCMFGKCDTKAATIQLYLK